MGRQKLDCQSRWSQIAQATEREARQNAMPGSAEHLSAIGALSFWAPACRARPREDSLSLRLLYRRVQDPCGPTDRGLGTDPEGRVRPAARSWSLRSLTPVRLPQYRAAVLTKRHGRSLAQGR